MNFINMGLFEADVEVTSLPSKKRKAVLSIDTNGFGMIGKYRIPDYEYGSRCLDISKGVHSLPEDLKPFCYKTFIKSMNGRYGLTTNPKDDDYRSSNGHRGLYMIAIPFRKRITSITPSSNVVIYKTCFTSCNQTVPKRPFVWAPSKKNQKSDKRYEYVKTLYIVAEADIVNPFQANEEELGSITIVESGMSPDEAKNIIELSTVPNTKITTNVTEHVIRVPLMYNKLDSLDNCETCGVIDEPLYPHTIPVEMVTLTDNDAVDMANRILGVTPVLNQSL